MIATYRNSRRGKESEHPKGLGFVPNPLPYFIYYHDLIQRPSIQLMEVAGVTQNQNIIFHM